MPHDKPLHPSLMDSLREETLVSESSIHEYFDDIRSAEKERLLSNQKRQELLHSLRQSIRQSDTEGSSITFRQNFSRILHDGQTREIEEFIRNYETEIARIKSKLSLSSQSIRLHQLFLEHYQLFVKKKLFWEKVDKSIAAFKQENTLSSPNTQSESSLELTIAKLSTLLLSTREELTSHMELVFSTFEQLENQIEKDRSEEESNRQFFFVCLSSIDESKRIHLFNLYKVKAKNASIEQRILFFKSIIEQLAGSIPFIAEKIHKLSRKNARTYIQRGQFNQAITELCYALHLWKNDSDTYRLLSHVFFRQQNEFNAMIALNEVLRLNPDDHSLRKRIAIYHKKNGDNAKALQEYAELVRRNPQDIQASRDLALLLFELGSYEKVPEYLEKYVRQFPNEILELKVMGESYQRYGDERRAIFFLERANILSPHDIDLSLSLSSAYRHENMYDDALRCLQQSLTLNPTSTQLMLSLAVTYQECSRWHEAEHWYRILIDQESSSASLYWALGNILGETSKYDEAITQLEKAIVLDHSLHGIWFDLSKWLQRKGDYSRAESSIKQALRFDESDEDAWQELSLIYSLQGKWQEATSALKQIASRNSRK